MTLFATSKIRVIYMLPMHQPEILSTFNNTNPEGSAKYNGKQNMTKEERGKMNFVRRNSYHQAITTKFLPELNGIMTYA